MFLILGVSYFGALCTVGEEFSCWWSQSDVAISVVMLLMSLAVMCDMNSFFLCLAANIEVDTPRSSLDCLVVLDTVELVLLFLAVCLCNLSWRPHLRIIATLVSTWCWMLSVLVNPVWLLLILGESCWCRWLIALCCWCLRMRLTFCLLDDWWYVSVKGGFLLDRSCSVPRLIISTAEDLIPILESVTFTWEDTHLNFIWGVKLYD